MLANQENVEISFFKNKSDYNLNKVALIKNVVPLRKSLKFGAKSNVLVYRFCLKFDEIKELLNESKIYFRLPIKLDSNENLVYGEFIKLNLDALKLAVLNGLSMFYKKFYKTDETQKN